MHSSKHIEHNIKFVYSTSTTHDCTSAQSVINWNTSVAGHKKRDGRLPIVNHCQGQLQTLQSVTAPSHVSYDIPSDLVHKIFIIMMK